MHTRSRTQSTMPSIKRSDILDVEMNRRPSLDEEVPQKRRRKDD